MDEQTLENEIESIDSEIVELLRRRAGRSDQLSQCSTRPRSQLDRETVSRVTAQAGDGLSGCAAAVFRAVAAADQSRRSEAAGLRSKSWDALSRALKETPPLFPENAAVACQGVEGAYSQIACEHLFKNPSIMFFSSFEHVFRAVEAGLCSYGVLPIENSAAGSVNAVYDLMLSHSFSIVRSARMRVSHCLLALPGTKPEDIKEVFSHPQAIDQCAGFLAGMGSIKITPAANTALAAKMLAQSGRTDAAALSSRSCGENYGLEILKEGVQDKDGNYTRFICIAKTPQVYPGADRLSLMMTLPHKPGSLYNALSVFNSLGINVRKLESRPLPDREFEFMFYFDAEVSLYSPAAEKLLRDLENNCGLMRCLGAYSEVLC